MEVRPEKARVGVSVKLVKDLWQSHLKISLFQMSQAVFF